jgi:hypothetical protein
MSLAFPYHNTEICQGESGYFSKKTNIPYINLEVKMSSWNRPSPKFSFPDWGTCPLNWKNEDQGEQAAIK